MKNEISMQFLRIFNATFVFIKNIYLPGALVPIVKLHALANATKSLN
jgi:hypothetical protein